MGGDDLLLFTKSAYVVCVPLLLYFMSRRCHVFDGVRPSGVLFGLLTLMYYVDAVPFVTEHCANAPDLAVRYLGVVFLMFVGVGAGMLLGDQFIRPAGKGGATFRLTPGSSPFGNGLLFGGAIVSLSVLAAYHFAATGGYTSILKFASFEGDPWFLIELRESAAAQVPGTYATNLARFAILPPLALALVSDALHRRTAGAVGLAIAAWAGVLISRMATLHKAPATFWLLGLVLLWATLGRVKRPMRIMAVGVAGAALLMVFLYGFIYGEGLREGWEHTVERTTGVPQFSVLFYLKTFPDLHEHLHGSSISFVQRLSGDHVTPSYAVLMDLWRIGGTPNAGFIGDGWADFGWAGVVGTSLLVGLTVRLLESLVLSMPRTALFHGCYVAVILSTVNLTSVSFWTTLLTHGLGLGPIVVFALWLLRPKTTPTSQVSPRGSTSLATKPRFQG